MTKIPLSEIHVRENNPRKITDSKFEQLIDTLLTFPKMLNYRQIVVERDGTIIAGNMRYRALMAILGMNIFEIESRIKNSKEFDKLTLPEVDQLMQYWDEFLTHRSAPIVYADDLTDHELRKFIALDNIPFGDWDEQMLMEEWDKEQLDDWGISVEWNEEDISGGSGSGGSEDTKPRATLQDRFVVPPFSVLDARQGYWQERKKAWREMIGDMGESRNDTLFKSLEVKYKDIYQRTRAHREELGVGFKEYLEKYVSEEEKTASSKIVAAGVSILDPVLAELACRWFGTGEICKTFDPFAGDTVFGYVSAYLGNDFTGIELREEQATLNNERVAGMSARYICDDGQNVSTHLEPESQDLLFSCPPYFDLEVYSDKENDASNQANYAGFLKILERAFTESISCLRSNRFAVIVVGDIRNKNTGAYYNFTDDVKRIFLSSGTVLYNELVLVSAVGSAAMRAAKYMDSRKVARIHQHVLVFYKGDPRTIKDNFKKIEYAAEDLELFRVDNGNNTDDTQDDV